jgi:YidC/Oxa1 family membrane protein insertase
MMAATELAGTRRSAGFFVRSLALPMLLLLHLSAHAGQFVVTAGHSQITFDEQQAVPLRWVLCSEICDADANHRATLFDTDDGYVRISSSDGPGGSFTARVDEAADEVIVTFESRRHSYVYRISRLTPGLKIELPPLAKFEIATGSAFVPEQLPGFGQIYSRVRPVQVGAVGQEDIEELEAGPRIIAAATDNWTGIRNRYWAFLVRPAAEPVEATVSLLRPDRPSMTFKSEVETESSNVHIYAGPVEWSALKSVSPDLSEMLFAALWDFLRALCFGMLVLLGWLQELVGSYGLAIILLSLTVKVLMSPLTMLADRWQADVNRQHTLLKPDLDEIKRTYKGEEAHRRVLAVYKKHNVSQFYTFKSAAGFLIQIPVFIAAFDMLAENIALNEVAFLWIDNLAKPDRLARLPFVIPFFGGALNLLPFLMTALSALAAWLQADDTLSADLQRQQSIRLYLMSAAFFVLFYTFPAGMVLYWTSSNLFHLLKVEFAGLVARLSSGQG